MHVDSISTIPLFDTVPRRGRADVARAVDRLCVPAGKTLIRQGDLGHEFFVILDGAVEVLRDEMPIAGLETGDFFGEIALVGRPYRTASVVTTTEVDLAVVPRREFRMLLQRFPDLATRVLSAGRERAVTSLRALEAVA